MRPGRSRSARARVDHFRRGRGLRTSSKKRVVRRFVSSSSRVEKMFAASEYRWRVPLWSWRRRRGSPDRATLRVTGHPRNERASLAFVVDRFAVGNASESPPMRSAARTRRSRTTRRRRKSPFAIVRIRSPPGPERRARRRRVRLRGVPTVCAPPPRVSRRGTGGTQSAFFAPPPPRRGGTSVELVRHGLERAAEPTLRLAHHPLRLCLRRRHERVHLRPPVVRPADAPKPPPADWNAGPPPESLRP